MHAGRAQSGSGRPGHTVPVFGAESRRCCRGSRIGNNIRLAILGNAGGGKSTLSAKISAARGIPHLEIDKILWKPNWERVPDSEYTRAHREFIDQDAWVIDGFGLPGSLDARFERATHIILIDFPLWQHFWLMAERQLNWAMGKDDQRPGGNAQMPPTRDLFEFVDYIDRELMPVLRDKIAAAEQDTQVYRITSFDDLVAFEMPAD